MKKIWGSTYHSISIPTEYRKQRMTYREKLFDKLSLLDDEFM